MRFCYFAIFEGSQSVSAQDLALVRECVRGLGGLSKGHLYTPAVARDLHADGHPSPLFALQLFFDEISSLEAAIGPRGAVKRLANDGELTRLGNAQITQQAMLNREVAVPEAAPAARDACSYLVHYPGPAENLNEWLAHYAERHLPLMASLPGVREVEMLTRIDWVDAMPWRRSHHMQRNRVMFDSPEALTAALRSPTRREMRQDLEGFPRFSGGNFHFPMTTEVVRP